MSGSGVCLTRAPSKVPQNAFARWPPRRGTVRRCGWAPLIHRRRQVINLLVDAFGGVVHNVEWAALTTSSQHMAEARHSAGRDRSRARAECSGRAEHKLHTN